MVKQSKLELDGEIIEVLPAGKFKVKLDEMDTVIMCYKSGKMKMSHISVIEGDKVKVEVSPYDVSQGRIVYRYNLSRPGSGPQYGQSGSANSRPAPVVNTDKKST